MFKGLVGKRVLVTASTKGIGKAVAKEFLRNNAKVVICSRNKGNLMNALKELGNIGEVYGTVADIAVYNDIERLVNFTLEKLGSIDILVYNTGGPPPGTFQEIGLDEWEKATRLLLMGAVWITKLTLPYIIQNKGSIIYLTSVAIKEPIDNLILSNTVRLSIAGLVKSLSKELGPYGVRVNMVLPGATLTDRIYELMSVMARKRGVSVEEILKEKASTIPLRRMGKPEEIANAVVFLASDYALYITGVALQVDGGSTSFVF